MRRITIDICGPITTFSVLPWSTHRNRFPTEKKRQKRRNTKQMEEGDDIENMVTGKELRQRYVGSGNEQKMSSSLSNQGNDNYKGKKGKSGSNSKEILTAASIAIVAVLIITLLLVFAIHFFQSSD
jgi:hypothetical protein